MNFNIIDFIVSIFDLTVYEYVREVFGDQPWVEPVLDIVGILNERNPDQVCMPSYKSQIFQVFPGNGWNPDGTARKIYPFLVF